MNPKIKIIFISNNNIGFGLSGGDTIFLQFLKNWHNKLNITFFGSQESQSLISNLKLNNISFFKTSSTNPNHNLSTNNLVFHQIIRTLKGTYSIIKNRQIIKNNQYIYSVSDFYPDWFPAFIAKIINPRIKWIAGFYLFAPNPFSKDSPYNQNGQYVKGFIYYFFQQFTIFFIRKYADIVMVTSDPDSKKFNQKTIVVRGGVDFFEIKKISSISLSKRKYHAVFMGRLHPQKGVIKLLYIWRLVVKKIPHAKLAIIGGGQLENQIKVIIKKLGLNKNVDMFGYLEGSNKYQVFANSKIVVHPATYDSGGMSAAEAMAFGLPLVSFDLDSLTTYYPKGCLKTKCFSNKDFSNNIIKLLKHPSLYKKLSLQAQKLIKTDFNWQKRSHQIFHQLFI